jgi:3-oxoacyl-[acyl-carrier protein] reductase
MVELRRGSIVMMGSVSSRVIDRPVTASYVAAKAGALMLMRHAALELGAFGIRVNAIAPGTVSSERVMRMTDDDVREAVARLSPLGRLGSPDDCAVATVFLASDVSGWITGVTLDVAGGRVMI